MTGAWSRLRQLRMTKILKAVATLLVGVSTSLPAEPTSPAASPGDRALTQYLAQADWSAALTCFPNQRPLAPPLEVARSHCLLLLNRNNESLDGFLRSSGRSAIESWDAWTAGFVTLYPSNEVAAYFRGDAQARAGNWQGAVAEYDRSLRIRPGFAAALSARGVAHLKIGDRVRAYADLQAACQAAPGFADAHASLGTFWVMGENAEGAAPAYRRAFALDPRFGLALNGLGCAEFGYGTNDLATLELFRAAGASCPLIGRLAAGNAYAVLQVTANRLQRQLVDGRAGTTISSSAELLQEMQDLQRDIDWNQKVLNALPYVPSVSFRGVGWDKSSMEDNTLRNMARQQEQLDRIKEQLRANDIDAGGATTRPLEEAVCDQGRWPVTTWFGLAQEVPVRSGQPGL